MFSTADNSIKLTQITGRNGKDDISDDTFVSLYDEYIFLCGGVFVSNQYILFLAQCTFGVVPVNNIAILSYSMGVLSVKDIFYDNNKTPKIGLVLVSILHKI